MCILQKLKQTAISKLMKKKGTLKIVAFLLLWLTFNLSAQAQSRKYFIINGMVMSEVNSNDSCSVQITKNNVKPLLAPVPSHGRFRLELEYNAEYKLVFTRKGNQTKTIIVNTEIPENSLCDVANFPHFLMAVKLYSDSQNPENLYSGDQVQRVSYFPQKKCFSRVPTILDVEYVEKGITQQNQAIQSQLNKTRLQAYQVF